MSNIDAVGGDNFSLAVVAKIGSRFSAPRQAKLTHRRAKKSIQLQKKKLYI